MSYERPLLPVPTPDQVRRWRDQRNAAAPAPDRDYIFDFHAAAKVAAVDVVHVAYGAPRPAGQSDERERAEDARQESLRAARRVVALAGWRLLRTDKGGEREGGAVDVDVWGPA